MTDLLRDEWKFDGYIVSDWMDIERLHDYHRVTESYADAFVLSVQSGMDMHMHGPDFMEALLEAVKDGRLTEKRIDQSVRRILTAKFKLGLFEIPISMKPKAKTYSSIKPISKQPSKLRINPLYY